MEEKEMGAGRSKKIDQFLYEKLSERYFKFWMAFTSTFPLPFYRPSSSTGKYHRDKAGLGHNLETHTLDLMYFVDKLATIFGDSKQEQSYDLLLLGAALHDVHKYGLGNTRTHTTSDHGAITARAVLREGPKLELSQEESEFLSNIIMLHDGRWHSDNPSRMPIEFSQAALFIHVADMASSRRILKFD